MQWHEFLGAVLAGLAALIVIVGMFIYMPMEIAHDNNQKVQNMMELCIDAGYDGWNDDYTEDSILACYKD